MLRRILIISSIFIYLASNSHLKIGLHFCCGKLVEWSLLGDAKKCCESSKTHKNCCKDVQITLASSDDHAAPDSFFMEFAQDFGVMPFCEQPISSPANVESGPLTHCSHAPPGISSRSIFLICENFRL